MAPNRSMSPAEGTQLVAGGSPPPLSKRDKKRGMLLDKLNTMIRDFNQNMRPHYEAQVQAVQVDINLIMKADPYQNKPLPDSGEDIDQTIQELFGGQLMLEPSVEQDFHADAGKWYSQFAKGVNDLMEEKDVALTMLANKHERALDELERKHRFHVRLAHEEHRILSATVRQRLHARLRKRRETLMMEKEALDIGDSNAALLHPDKYTHMNPSSPGGAHPGRKTRNARHKAADPDELPSAASALENRRKRKAAFEETDGSPGPASRHLDYAAGSTFRDVKSRTLYSQFEAPAYSIDRLFTEKELAMNMNTAALAARNFMMTFKDRSKEDEPTNGVNGHGLEGDDAGAGPGVPAITGDLMDADEDGTPAAADMDRSASSQPYQTRIATRSALADFADIAAGNVPFESHSIPTFVPALIGTKASGAAPAPAPAIPDSVDRDFELMRRMDVGGDDMISNRMLEHAVGSVEENEPGGRKNWVEYRYETPATVNAADRDDAGATRELLAGIGGVDMSRQTSLGGTSDGGGLPMNRNGSSMGGVGLRRTASGVGRRARA